MEKLSLDRVWELTETQWKYVQEFPEPPSPGAKRKWLKKNGFGENRPLHDCFFCEYARQQGENPAFEYLGYSCGAKNCPGKLVDTAFNCQQTEYDWRYHPKKFYKKICELNELRKKKMEAYISIDGEKFKISEETARNFKEKFGAKEETYKVGDCFERKGEYFMIIHIGDRGCMLTGLWNGFVWGRRVEPKVLSSITKAEFKRMNGFACEMKKVDKSEVRL